MRTAEFLSWHQLCSSLACYDRNDYRTFKFRQLALGFIPTTFTEKMLQTPQNYQENLFRILRFSWVFARRCSIGSRKFQILNFLKLITSYMFQVMFQVLDKQSRKIENMLRRPQYFATWFTDICQISRISTD